MNGLRRLPDRRGSVAVVGDPAQEDYGNRSIFTRFGWIFPFLRGIRRVKNHVAVSSHVPKFTLSTRGRIPHEIR